MHEGLKVHAQVILQDMRPLHDQLISGTIFFLNYPAFNRNFSEEIGRINLRPLKQTFDGISLHRMAPASINSSSPSLRSQSFLDLRKSGMTSVGTASTSEELRQFSDMKRHTALNLLLMESTGVKNDSIAEVPIKKRSNLAYTPPEKNINVPSSNGKMKKKFMKYFSSKIKF